MSFDGLFGLAGLRLSLAGYKVRFLFVSLLVAKN